MRKLVDYLLDRFREPGTLRSLVAILVGLHQGARAETMTDNFVALGLVALGAVSALREENK